MCLKFSCEIYSFEHNNSTFQIHKFSLLFRAICREDQYMNLFSVKNGVQLSIL